MCGDRYTEERSTEGREKGDVMQNPEKYEIIRKWIDPDERVTVDFLDEKDVSAAIIDGTTEHVALSIQTKFPHVKQHVSVSLGNVELGEDRNHYSRDPNRPLQHARLRMMINQKRPQWV